MKKYTLTIEVEYGSESQKNKWASILSDFKETIKEMEQSHKKNSVRIREEYK